MQDLIRPDASFTPRELFSRMQGAWFEPRQGSMWQENTGATATTDGGQTIGKLVDLSAGRVASQATAANRPTLQFNGTLPLIRHADSTDVLTATLPAINVRRNLLTYSEQFDNAAWTKQGIAAVTKNTTLAPDGISSASTLTLPGYTGSFLYIGVAVSAVTYTLSVYVKSLSGTMTNVTLNLYNGNNNQASSPFTVTTEWRRITWTFTIANAGFVNFYTPQLTGAGGSIYIWGAQLELGSVATDYQKITDWTSEAYSSSGSTYFATAVGMSCLHNQSIGTTYNLPALQTDIYVVVITPARLAPPLEQRLASYMHRLAGLADADFFWQEQATDGMTGQLLADDGTILLRG